MEAENYQQDFPSLDKVDSGNSPMAGNNSDEARQDPQETNMGNQWGYEDSSQVADPNVAIPMPYVGPLLQGQNRSTVPESYDVPRNEGATQTGDIPMAPTSQADAVGPPNQNNTNQQITSVD